MNKSRDASGRFVSKAIADTANNGGKSTPQAKDQSVVGSASFAASLSPKQAYELSIAVRRAIDAKANDKSKAKLRIFSVSSGDEIISGSLYQLLRRPNRQMTGSRFVAELSKWWDLKNEMAVNVGGIPGAVTGLSILDPYTISELPTPVYELEKVEKWVHTLGGVRVELPVERVCYAKGWNPYSQVRGLSPLLTGVNEVSTNYFSQRFNSAFFQNGAHTDVIARFAKGTRKEIAEQWVNQYEANHSILNGRAFKISAVIADELEIHTPGQEIKDGHFINLQNYNDEAIGRLFGVPASIMAFYARVRFDTVDAELESYYENTLLPEMTMISEFLQTQLVDRYFPNAASGTKKEKAKLGPTMKKALEKAMDERRGANSILFPESDVVVLLDPDTLPIAAKLNVKKLDAAQKYRTVMGVSYKAAAEWAGIDRETNEVDELIVVPSTEQVLNPPQSEEEEGEEVPQPVEAPDLNDAVSDEASEEAEKAVVGHARDYYRDLRALVCDKLDKGEWFGKTDAEKLLVEHGIAVPNLKLQLAKDHLAIIAIDRDNQLDKGQKIRAAKDYFNSITKAASLRGIVKGEAK
jgi:HK97 family phage portal protein